MLPQSISAIVHAAIDTGRSVELDTFIVRLILARAGETRGASARRPARPRIRIAINFTPASLLDPRRSRRGHSRRWSKRRAVAAPDHARVHRAAGRPRRRPAQAPGQDAPPARVRLRRRRRGGGLRELRPDRRPPPVDHQDRPRLIAAGVARDDAKQALVEAFVSFGRRIGARLLAEGIERRADLSMLTARSASSWGRAT